jgi:excisionase family DNA binding protein
VRPSEDPTAERWLSTHEAANVIGCHPQTVRDKCARGELPFEVDPATGHRRIAASELSARGYTVTAATNGHPRRRPRSDFHALLTAEVEGALAEGTAELISEVIAERLTTVFAERDAALTATAQRLGETRAAPEALACAHFWQRRRLLARLRAAGTVARQS